MRRVKWLSIMLAFCMLLSLAGCGKAQEAGSEMQEIELLEPINAQINTEEAACRNLYSTKVYSAVVVPETTEYYFTESVKVEDFCAYPGDDVKKGETLVVADSEKLEEQIEAMEERIAAMDEEIDEYLEDYAEKSAEDGEEVKRLKEIVENLEDAEPEEYLYSGEAVSSGDAETSAEMIRTPEYIAWLREYDTYNGKYRIDAHNMKMAETAKEQKAALYALDRAYAVMQLEDLKEKKLDTKLVADRNGEIVAVGQMDYGAYSVQAEVPVIAVGDMDSLLLQCDYINKSTAAGAKEIYALIDGVRYGVTYQPMDTAEYERLDAKGEKIYTTFTLEGETKEVQAGDFAVIVIVNERKENVLTVRKDAIHKEGGLHFVYVREGGQNVQKVIHVGMSDGVYTEVTKGLAEGDMVVLSDAVEYGSKTATIKKGEFHSSYEGSGFMYYPSTDIVTNPVTYGTVYFGEYEVAEYQHVDKGETIATVRVVADEIALQRMDVKITRLQERLNDLEASYEKPYTQEQEEYLADKREEIAEAQEERDLMLTDAAVTRIKAPVTGIVVGLGEYETEDIIKSWDGIVEIADEKNCYVVVEDEKGLLNYGNQVEITYQNRDNITRTSSGSVANLTRAGVTQSLRTEYVMIGLSSENIADMAVTNTTPGNWWNPLRYNVTAQIREMDNVLVVPKKAVTEKQGCTYVNVIEDGKVVARSFVAGGYDSANYWVIEGLTEGMEVCLE